MKKNFEIEGDEVDRPTREKVIAEAKAMLDGTLQENAADDLQFFVAVIKEDGSINTCGSCHPSGLREIAKAAVLQLLSWRV